jgi:ABC-type Mn2+/Zn2+ transport system permease subunit
MLLAAAVGAGSGVVGIYAAWHLRIASSAAIVLTMTLVFIASFLFAPGRGYVWALLGRSAETA